MPVQIRSVTLYAGYEMTSYLRIGVLGTEKVILPVWRNLADAADSKSVVHYGRAGSIPATGTLREWRN